MVSTNSALFITCHFAVSTTKANITDCFHATGSTILVRPDSGDPATVISETLEGLIAQFGSTTNSKGYRVLPDYIRAAQGDGLTLETLKEIYAELDRRRIAADNIYLGMGGGLLQYINRDTLAFTQKANSININGEWRDIYKQPKSDSAKTSKRGRLALVIRDGEYTTVRKEEAREGEVNLLKPIYRNGKLLVNHNFEDLIERSERKVPPEYYQPVWASKEKAPNGIKN